MATTLITYENAQQAEKTIHESEMRFRCVVESSLQGIMIRSGEQIQYSNAACARIFGYDGPDELVGQPWHFLVAPEEIPTHRARAEACLRGESVPPLPAWQGIRKDGTRIWLESAASPFNWEGKPAILGFVTDITQRKQAEAVQARLGVILESTPDLVAIAHVDGPVTYLNPAGRRMLECEGSEPIYLSNYRTPEMSAFVMEKAVPTAIRLGLWQGETSYLSGTGRTIDVSQVIVAHKNAQGELDFISTVARDITELKRAEEGLLVFRALIDQSNDGIEVVDPETGRFLDVNEKACQAHGYTREEYLSLTVSDIDPFVTADSWPAVATSVRQSRFQVFQNQHKRKDGSVFPVEVHVNYVHLDRDYMLAVVHDVTERKRAEQRTGVEHAVTRVLAASPSLADAGSLMLQAICDALDWDASGLWSVDTAAQVLRCVQTWQKPALYAEEFELVTREITFAPEVCLPGWVWSRREPQWIADVAQSTQFQRAPFAAKLGLHGGLAFPILFENSVLGVIEFFSHEIRQPDEDLLRMMAAIGSQIGQFIERKRAEESRRAAEERSRLILDTANDSFVRIDTGGRVLDWNRQAENVFGWSRAEVVGRPLADFIIPHQHRQAHEQGIQVFQVTGQGPILNKLTEITARRRDGTEFPVELAVWPIHVDGDCTISAFVRDITERKQAEEKLRAAQQRLQHVVSSSPAVLFTLAVEGETLRPIWVSDNLQEMLGYSLADVLEGSWYSHIHPDDQTRVAENTLQSLRTHDYVTNEYRFQHKNGAYRWIRSEKRLLRDGTGNPLEVIGSWSDISERKHLEDQFRQAQKMDAIGKLAGGIAHDFNNLLTVIMGYSDVVFDRLHVGDPLRDFVDEVRKSGRRAASLTRQLLAFSRKQVLVAEVVDLNSLLSEMEKMLTRLIGEDIALTFVPDPSLWKVKVDRGQTEQVIMNLVLNARDAMALGGKLTVETANVELDRDYSNLHPHAQPGHYVLVSVSDTGCGMNEATRLRVFEPFFTTKGPEKGTGLGLSTAYGIVKQSNGFIEVHSEPGKGSTFKIYLPRVGDEFPKKKSRSVEIAPGRGSETVLLVEDEAGVRTLARLVLEKEGYAIIEARNGCHALLLSQQHGGSIQLMATDVVMPDMTGPELAKQLTALRPDMKVLFLSGYTDDAIIHHGFIDDEMAFLQKPFTKSGLLRKVREVLDQR